ncbi:hypothetical protein XMM379_002093 [Aliiroseovarius sp. xm-m-379]|uniref:DUF411 domain-containing protein n=1 Tax=unclassified Aliiroseovarius TaxID=2623558 RepID=UPI001568775D|nr:MULTISPECIES: DUF411 domain-containing protein [unclassified Aliiroseovarius]NRP13959.1 hypothetical protein [Aliiroseovarius sp. xm-d-517]NRP25396.1 hypothetical protein [Aliiroseovarius sp. xm-m-379]NRP29388.1 hypothetical protein [Aliiroseovarius sp. xm-m-314]NRP34195.1 hypothetical protein [Aliiroseovarius sp. xm-a-104]NRP41846.1 hypothetical protein [Aliiroseovarius sp. xm-m-339-2]
MTQSLITRRHVLAGLLATPALSALPAFATTPHLIVHKDPSCGCCGAWVKVMQSSGFTAEINNMDYDTLYEFKRAGGIQDDLMSCHTAEVEGYLIEGHVPAPDLNRLLAERPEAIGLTVPGMPYGAPGMGPESERDAYDVLLMRKDGSTELFARYPAA